jgi:hypothetical protein
VLANQRDFPYQSLLKVYLAERIAAERRASAKRFAAADSDDVERRCNRAQR